MQTTSELKITDTRLEPVAAKVLAGERLNAEDGLALYESHDLLALGWLANHVREKKHGNICYYNVNRHINPTNVCVAHCRLCAFGRSPDAPGAYTFALDEIYKRAAEGVAEGATEFHIVGGLHPDLPFEYYLELIRGLKQRFPRSSPESVHDGGSGLLRAHFQAFDSRHASGDEECRCRLAARRRRGDFSSARAQGDLRSQSERPDVAADRANRPRNRPALERDDAVRPHRDSRRARGPSAPASRHAGQNARLRHVHSARISSREYGARRICPDQPESTI